MTPEIIYKYFPALSSRQKEKISQLKALYEQWNSRINVISRKDMDNFYTHHVLHSLSIVKLIRFKTATSVLDVGTGGGFPGIPLAILFPEVRFVLLDSTSKKIRVVSEIAGELNLENVTPVWRRCEDEKDRYDFVVSRAVSDLASFEQLTRKNISGKSFNSIENGIIYLKGGDIIAETVKLRSAVKVYNISDFFSEPFFETKKIVYIT